MRKLFTSLFAIVLAAMMLMLSGCNLVVTNDEKDMNQIIATVQITDDAPLDKVYKKDLAMAYLNYGYYYEQSGYTRKQVIDLIMNNLTITRVYVQNAINKFDENDGMFANQIVDSSITDKWNLDRYLTEEELIDIVYETKLSMSKLIDSYEEADDKKLGDTIWEEVRAVPTNATNAEEEVSEQEKKDYEIDTNSSSKRRTAYNKVIKLLETNALLGEYKNDITETDYYAKTLKATKEQKIISKYEKCLSDSVHKDYDLNDVRDLFNEKLDAQKKWSDSEYFTALSAASATSPILYAPTGTYGFVYNLLLGASTELQTELSNWKNDNPELGNDTAEIAKQRKEIFKSITAKDLRSTWILSGYDFDGVKFTGDYALAAESLAFQGTVKHLNAGDVENEDYKAEYGVTNVTEFDLDGIVSLIENYIYGSDVTDNVGITDPSVLKAYNSSTALEGFEDRVNELIFAFSTDPGSLNTYKGYAISPIPDGGNKETYKDEFAIYGRKLLEMGDKSYMIVATDYGYHVLFFSERYDAGVVYGDLDSYLNGECIKLKESGETWETYFAKMQDEWNEIKDTNNYLYTLYSELVSNKIALVVNQDENEMINNYVYGENSKVVKYESRYANWLN